MKNHNPENERTKRAYFAFLKESKGLSETSIDAAAQAIARFEANTRWKSFKAFHFEQATAFKRQLAVASEEPRAAMHRAEDRLKAAYAELDRMRSAARSDGEAGSSELSDGFAATRPMRNDL